MPSSNLSSMPANAQAVASDAAEAAIIEQFVEREARLHREAYADGERPVLRRLHAKLHGLVVANFRVHADIPQQLKAGLFATPAGYDAVVRFSNGSGKVQHDLAPDARGMAIKLFGVPGKKVLAEEPEATTHDFTLLNHDVFFTRNPADFSEFASSVDRFGHPFFFLLRPFPPKIRLHEALILARSTKPIDNPLAVRYWSQSPYALGDLEVKFSCVPRLMAPRQCVAFKTENYLQEAMKAQLSFGGVEFDFMVQVRTNQQRMPIEDPTISWSESESPFIKVATLSIAAQEFVTPQRQQANERLSFSPWHCLPEHRPLGGINRMRMLAYRASQIVRHAGNSQRRIEPVSLAQALEEASENSANHP